MSAQSETSPGARERDIFLSALEKTPSERTVFLDAACANDDQLRQRVEGLLHDQKDIGGFLESAAVSGTGTDPHRTRFLASVTEQPGAQIGRYKLLQQVGEGGCGVVYMAEQEKPVRRRVALKIIRLGMDTKSVIARFEAERQALAMMEHPNIAKVLDAGTTESGRPYFVMELVRGIRITEYCDQNNLSTQERLKLFILVCQAIQHAHQKGIIHRDVKPSNILVTLHDGVPVPKVIDFGIAKATEQRLTDKTFFTEFQTFIGTPAYTSPEQAEMSGLDADTRSDIYSLGVLLYELLTGETPFDPEHLMRSGLNEMRRMIREDEPLRPSTRLSTLGMVDATTITTTRQTKLPTLVDAVRGDLDWIVMKCLEKDRTRRYATANDLAADVQHHLASEPVLARPPSNLYRLQKLLHRHRGAFAAAAAIIVTLVVGAGFSAWQAVRATRAEVTALTAQKQETELRRQAEQEKASARLNEYVADINLAQQSLAAGNYGRAVQLLNKHRPLSGEPDLRGFEWRYLWQLSRGDDHIALPTQDGAILSLSVTPSSNLLAVGLREKFTLWNLSTKSPLTSVPKGGLSLDFFPDGDKLVSASYTTVRIWNTSSWTGIQALPNNSGPAALSPDAKRLATLSREGVRVWDTSTWKEVRLLEGASGPIAFSPNGREIVTSTEETLTVWPLGGDGSPVRLQDSTNLFRRSNPRSRRGRALSFSPDGKSVVAARNSLSERGVFVLSVWDARSGEETAVIPDDAAHIEHAGMITSLAFSPDGKTLASASMDYSVRLWDLVNRRRVAILQGHLSEVWALAFSPDGQSLISGSKDGELKLWPTQAAQKEDILTGVRHPLAFSKDGRTLAGLTRESRDGSSVFFLNLNTGEPEEQFRLEGRNRFGPFGPSVVLSEDLHTLIHGLGDGTIKVWDRKTGENTLLKLADEPLEVIAASPDAQVLVTRSRRWVLHRWDLLSGTSKVWPTPAFKVLFAPHGRTLATIGRGNAVQLWDSTTLEPLAKFQTDEQPAFGFTASFSSDGSILAVAYQDDAIRLWDVTTGQLVGTCTGHKQDLRSVSFSPDGKTLATTSDDSTLNLWNVATQQQLLTIRQLGATLTGLMFSPDGQMLVGGSGAFSSSGGIRFFHAPVID